MERLIEATKGSRNEARDRCLLLLMFRHGLRVSEACGLKLDQVDTESRVLHVARLKRGSIDDAAATRRRAARHQRMAERTRPDEARPARRFLSASSASRCTARPSICFCKNTAPPLPCPLLAHPHMLRHACGFALADQGADTRLIQDYLGHRKIEHTVKYTATNPARFERLWR